MTTLSRETKRNRKIARTLIRLRHSLAADEEIEDYLENEKKLLAGGQMPSLEVTLEDLNS
jgi:hypothetical protein